MDSYNRTVPASLVSYVNGSFQLLTAAALRTETMTVTNGRTRGDHVTPNNFSFTKTVVAYPYGSKTGWQEYGNGYAYLFEGSFSGSLSTPYTRPPTRRSVAYNKALAKLYEAIKQSERNLAVSLGESSESIHMFKSFLTGILKLKRGVRRALRRPDLALSGAWLVNQYGIKPALADIYQWVDYCRGKAEHFNSPVRARASVKDNADFSASSWPPVRSHCALIERVEVQALYRVSNPELFEITRITSLNPLAVAWELVPLSFVVDWAVDIGGYLQSMEDSLGLGLTFVNGYTTDTSLLTATGAWSGYRAKASSGYADTYIYAPYSVTEKKLSRVRMFSFPRPCLPRLDIHLGASRLLSAAALLNTLFLRRT